MYRFTRLSTAAACPRWHDHRDSSFFSEGVPMRRAHAVGAAALLLVGGVAGPSAALTTQVVTGCEDPSGYEPGQPCEVEVGRVLFLVGNEVMVGGWY